MNTFEFINEYGKYCVPKGDLHRPTAKRILNGGIHEPLTIEFIRDNYSGGDIIHAGAYFGDMLPAFSQIVGDRGKVWAFEPNERNYLCATKTIELNHLENVKLMNYGLGSYRTFTFLIVKDEQGKSMGGGSRIWNGENIKDSSHIERIELHCIDMVIPLDRQISIIHLDIEEFEGLAIAGAYEIIERNHPILILEGEHNNSSYWDLGYRFLKKVHNNSVLVWGS